MNNLEKYISEVDSIKADDKLKESILELNDVKKQKSSTAKIIPFIAAAVLILLVPAVVGNIISGSGSKDSIAYEGYDSEQAKDENAQEAVNEFYYSDKKIIYNESDDLTEEGSSEISDNYMIDGRTVFSADYPECKEILAIIENLKFNHSDSIENNPGRTVIQISDDVYYFDYENRIIVHDNKYAIITQEQADIIKNIISDFSD